MKFVAVLCILCLLIIGTVSAYAISPDAVREVKIINKTIDPRTIDLSHGSSNLPQVIRLGYVSITSIPSGAAITIDGLSTLDGTPIGVTNVSYLRMNPGDHTVTLKYPDYEDYTSAFSIKSDETTIITALLTPKKTLEVARIRQPAIRAAQPQLDTVQPASGNSLGAETPIPTPTIVPISCPENSICLLPLQAPVTFPNGFIQLDTRPCKNTWSNKTGQYEFSYCYGKKLILVVKPPQDVDVRQPVQQQVPAIRKDFIGSIISIFKPSTEETIRPLTGSSPPPTRSFIESILAIFSPQKVPDMSKIMFLTPQITQERYFTVSGKDFGYQSDEESISTLSMGDGYSDPRGWFVGTDSTVCISAPSDPGEQLFANHNILAGSQCEEGEKAYQTLDYRVKMFVDTNQFNGKPVQKAILKLSVAHTWKTQWSSSYGEAYPNGQTIKEVWYKKTDPFPVSYPDAFNNLDPLRGIYLANIPTEGVGANYATSPPDFGSPATGGQAWGTGAIALGPQPPQATWDPKARTLTIDMTDLVNDWITGRIENHGLVLKDGWPLSAPHAFFSAYKVESFEVTP